MKDFEDLDSVQLVDGLDPEQLLSILEVLWYESDAEMETPPPSPSPPAETPTFPVLPSSSPTPSSHSMTLPPDLHSPSPTIFPTPSPTPSPPPLPIMFFPDLHSPSPTIFPTPSPTLLPFFPQQPFNTFPVTHVNVPYAAPWTTFVPQPYFLQSQPQIYVSNVNLNLQHPEMGVLKHVGYFYPTQRMFVAEDPDPSIMLRRA